MSLKNLPLIFLLLFNLFFLSSCTAFKKMFFIMGDPPVSASAEVISEGEGLYQNYCMRCHGAEGTHDGPEMTAIPSKPEHQSFEEYLKKKSAKSVAANIKYGKGDFMPSFKEQLSNEEIWAIAHYIQNNFQRK